MGVRAQLNISYKQGNVADQLGLLYGPHDALHASALWRKASATAESVTYAARTGGLIVMAEFVGGQKLVLYVESSGGLLRDGAGKVWSEIRDEGEALKPKLRRLVLFDEDANDLIATAAVGLGGNLRREDLFVPVATGIVTAVVLALVSALGHPSADFLYGSATALGVAILSVGRLVQSFKSKELVWR